jgi:hypothetical protein
MRIVRASLLVLWLCLIGSLFYDPWSFELTDGAHPWSPFAISGKQIDIQGVLTDQYPYELGNRLFWTVIVPIIPIFLMVAGHETWRRICPLSLVSQLPGYLGFQRIRKRLDRRNGRVLKQIPLIARGSWLDRHALDVQLFLLYLGLCARLLFANSDRLSLAILLLTVIGAAFLVGVFLGGKSWCHYFCPIGVVQKIYTQPSGLLDSAPHKTNPAIAQSTCRRPSTGADTNACVGCTSRCPDIDLERSYWESVDRPELVRIYFGFLGLIYGFYLYFFLFAGNWNYYFSGIWTHEEYPLGQLLGPGFYIDYEAYPIPKFLAAPLTLALFVAVGMLVGIVIDRAYAAVRERISPGFSATLARHHVLMAAAFVAINSFYVFGGRPTILNFPLPIVRIIDTLLVALSVIWLIRALSRSPRRYRHESLAPIYLRELVSAGEKLEPALEGRRLDELSADEVSILAKAPGVMGAEERLSTYRKAVEALADQGDFSAQALVQLHHVRKELGITPSQHQKLVTDLDLPALYSLPDPSVDPSEVLRLINYRQSLVRLVQGIRSEEAIALLDQMPRSIQRDHLRALYQISDDEHQQAMEQLFMPSDIAEQQALQGLNHLAGLTAIRLLLRFHRDGDLQWEGLTRLMKRSLDEVSYEACEQVLSALRPLGESTRALHLAQSANRLGGSTLQQVLQALPSFDRSKIWIYQFGDNMRAVLQGIEQVSQDRGSPFAALPSLAEVMQDTERAWRALDEAVLHANEIFAALALAVLYRLDQKRALLAALHRWEQSDRRSAGMFLHVLQALMLEGGLSKGLWQIDKSGALQQHESLPTALGTTIQVSVNGNSLSEGLVPALDQVMVVQWQEFDRSSIGIWIPERKQPAGDTVLARILWLARAPLLASVPMQYLYELVQASDIVTATRQTRLLSAGVVSDEALFLIDGQLQVLRRDATGHELFLTTVEAGSLVGELAVLTGKPRRASIEVISESARLLRIQGSKLRELLARDLDVSNQLLRTVAGYVQ